MGVGYQLSWNQYPELGYQVFLRDSKILFLVSQWDTKKIFEFQTLSEMLK